MIGRVFTLVPALVLATAIVTRAQNVSVSPSFGITQMYDDNLFNRPAGEADTITRVSARLDAQYGSERRTFRGRYALDADRFARHPELTTAHARQDAGLEGQYRATRRLTFNGAAAFTETQTPADLNIDTALTPGRARARRLLVQPSAAYEVGPLTTATIGYTAASDRMLGVSLLAQTATLGVERHASARDEWRWEYSRQSYRFGAIERTTSHALSAAWTRHVTRATSVSLRGGPRVVNGTLSPDVAASLQHQMRIGEATLAYAHTRTTLIGLVGVADTHSLTARASGVLPSGLRLRAGPGLLRSTQPGLASTVYRVSVGCARPVARRLAIDASYDLNVQHGNFYARSVETIGRHVFVLALVATATGPARQ